MKPIQEQAPDKRLRGEGRLLDVLKSKTESWGPLGSRDLDTAGHRARTVSWDDLRPERAANALNAANKATTIVSPAGTATVRGEEFMKATWSIWFGKIDQPALGDSLIDRF